MLLLLRYNAFTVILDDIIPLLRRIIVVYVAVTIVPSTIKATFTRLTCNQITLIVSLLHCVRDAKYQACVSFMCVCVCAHDDDGALHCYPAPQYPPSSLSMCVCVCTYRRVTTCASVETRRVCVPRVDISLYLVGWFTFISLNSCVRGSEAPYIVTLASEHTVSLSPSQTL